MRTAQSRPSNRERAFTFTELLIVLAVAALLGLMISPSLARSRSDSRGFQCLSNNRELNRAWRMWTDDNNDLLLYAAYADRTGLNDQRVWLIHEGLDFSQNQTNRDGSVSIRLSPMWPYCGKNAAIWHCPSSYVVSNSIPVPRAYSYSMNFYLGGRAGSLVGVPSASAYRIYLKSSDITTPSPSKLFVFLDQRPDAINWGNFVVDMSGYSPSNPVQYQFNQDFPAFYHDGAATFSYADGHGEIYRWQDLRTTPPIAPTGTLPSLVPSPRNPDIAWLQDRATRPK